MNREATVRRRTVEGTAEHQHDGDARPSSHRGETDDQPPHDPLMIYVALLSAVDNLRKGKGQQHREGGDNMRLKYTAAAIAAAALAAAGCGSTISKSTTTHAAATQPSATTAQPPPTTAQPPPTTTQPPALTGPVGTPFTDTDDQGNKMAVTLTRVIDPAQGADQFTTPDNGNRFVAAKFLILGVSGTFSSDANNDAVIVGADGQTYQPDFNDTTAGTNFNSGEYTVTPGSRTVGVVNFQLPQSVRVESVQWGGQFGGQPATWTVR
jgi:hypothetical protein